MISTCAQQSCENYFMSNPWCYPCILWAIQLWLQPNRAKDYCRAHFPLDDPNFLFAENFEKALGCVRQTKFSPKNCCFCKNLQFSEPSVFSRKKLFGRKVEALEITQSCRADDSCDSWIAKTDSFHDSTFASSCLWAHFLWWRPTFRSKLRAPWSGSMWTARWSLTAFRSTPAVGDKKSGN